MADDDLDLGTEKLYFKIGEVAEIVGVPAHVLRFWESEFSGLKPQKSRSQQRVYRRKDVGLLLRIKHLLYEKRFTIAGARMQLKESPQGPGAAPSASYRARQSLKAVEEELAGLRTLVAADALVDGKAADPAAFVRERGGARAMVAAEATPRSPRPPAR